MLVPSPAAAAAALCTWTMNAAMPAWVISFPPALVPRTATRCACLCWRNAGSSAFLKRPTVCFERFPENRQDDECQ